MRIFNPLGVKGEQLAVEFIQKKGYTIIERNFRKNYGEIDIIAMRRDTLVFIEVKTRTNDQFGTGLEAITFWKLKSLIKTAQLYKAMHPKLPESLRIDAISVFVSKNGEVGIEHMENVSG